MGSGTIPSKKLECPQPSQPLRTINKNLQIWESELASDPDREFLLHGLNNGFPLVDTDPLLIKNSVSKNHKSALDKSDRVEKRLLEEIEDGNYIVTNPSAVTLVSPLAAIEKPDGDVRLIHDLSHPLGSSLNDYATKEECQYESLQDALDSLSPNMYMAKCDLKWAYRSVPIRPDHSPLTGLQWTFKGDNSPTTLMDTTLCFGARKSPAHFNRVTKSIKRMMVRRGFNCSVFLDDFLLYEDTMEQCAAALTTLIALLRSLGFRINWKKVVDPCQRLVFLGIEIDTVNNKLSLDPDKATQLISTLDQTTSKKRLSKKQLQKLAGKLNWACNVFTWGRAFMNTFFQAICQLNAADHRMRITTSMLSDIR